GVPGLAAPPTSPANGAQAVASWCARRWWAHRCPPCGLILDRDHHDAALRLREAGVALAIAQEVWDPTTQRMRTSPPVRARGSATVGHTGPETRGDRWAPRGHRAVVGGPGGPNHASPGFSRAEGQLVHMVGVGTNVRRRVSEG